jgi:hypothetical protein
MTDEQWILTIEKVTGHLISVVGPEAQLRRELDSWIQYENHSAAELEELEKIGQEQLDIEGYKARTLYGFQSNVFRKPIVVAYRYHDVVGMILEKM